MGMRALHERNQMLAPGDFIVNKCGQLQAALCLRSLFTGRVRYGCVAINLVGFAMTFIHVWSLEFRFGRFPALSRVSFAHGDFSFPMMAPDTENSHF
jgi:hypothetical protein